MDFRSRPKKTFSCPEVRIHCYYPFLVHFEIKKKPILYTGDQKVNPIGILNSSFNPM